MLDVNNDFPHKNSEGEVRRVGFEIEFIDYSLDNSVELIQSLFGGHIRQENDHLIHVDETPYGKFSIERDLNLLQSLSKKSIENKSENKVDIEGVANELLTPLLKKVVPVEIVTPPLSFNQVDIVDLIIDELKKTPAKDTSKNIFSAFGLHINPELPGLDVDTIIHYLKAYCLLNAWLRDKIDVDFSRKILPFVDEYPRSYVSLILNESYQPDITTLIDDYIKHNKTRNRSLDMLPLFKNINHDQVTKLLPRESIKARPTFHYRLPNTSFTNDDWSVKKEWSRWLVVEILANNRELIKEMSIRYITLLNENVIFNVRKWIKETECFLEKVKK